MTVPGVSETVEPFALSTSSLSIGLTSAAGFLASALSAFWASGVSFLGSSLDGGSEAPASTRAMKSCSDNASVPRAISTILTAIKSIAAAIVVGINLKRGILPFHTGTDDIKQLLLHF